MAPELRKEVLQHRCQREPPEGDKSFHLDSRVTFVLLQESRDMHGEVLRCTHIIMSTSVNDYALQLCLGARDIQVVIDHANLALSLFNLG